MNKFCALLLLPLLPIAIVIDLLIGDWVTGVKTSALDKFRDHKRLWLERWNEVSL